MPDKFARAIRRDRNLRDKPSFVLEAREAERDNETLGGLLSRPIDVTFADQLAWLDKQRAAN